MRRFDGWLAGFLSLILVVAAASPAPAQAAPKTITNSIGMSLVLVPAGEFDMGARETQQELLRRFPYALPRWVEGEAPRHRVRITHSFYMGQHEVTLSQFLAFRNATSRPQGNVPPIVRPYWAGCEINMDHPAVYVSWQEADAFCHWLSAKEGKKYRLPWEAEWEYACRAGKSHLYSFGDNPDDLVQYANVADLDRQFDFLSTGLTSVIMAPDESGTKKHPSMYFPFLQRPDGYVWTAPVGRFLPNAFGLQDMHGNAWEWCGDWYNERAFAAERGVAIDPHGPTDGTWRVTRGGSFNSTTVNLRCASRDAEDPVNRNSDYGFRVVRESD